MEFRQLQLFLSVIEEAGVTLAAEKNHLSPGAVSLQMHSLADHLQAELFIRGSSTASDRRTAQAAMAVAELTNPRLVMIGYFQHPWKVCDCQIGIPKS